VASYALGGGYAIATSRTARRLSAGRCEEVPALLAFPAFWP